MHCMCIVYVLPKVILPLIISGLFFISVMAAIGRPQFATGPQKCCKGEKVQFRSRTEITKQKVMVSKIHKGDTNMTVNITPT